MMTSNLKRFQEVEVDGAQATIDWLMYKSYEFQRLNSPDRPAEDWRKIHMHQEIYEKIYQEKHGGHHD